MTNSKETPPERKHQDDDSLKAYLISVAIIIGIVLCLTMTCYGGIELTQKFISPH